MGELTTKQFFEQSSVQKKFEDLLGNKAPGFITSVLQVASSNKLLAQADPASIYNAAATAAILDLPVNQNLGFSYIIPYKGKAQFQIGVKGFIQLAQRSGQYVKINVTEVYKNQFTSYNALTEELNADFGIDGDDTVVGYAAYFELANGFKKTVYWSKKKVEEHAKKYSQAYKSKKGGTPWVDQFDDMAKKTVLKHIISKWGILSIEMQKAVTVDQAVIQDDSGDKVEYVDVKPVVEMPNIEEIKELYALKKGSMGAQEKLNAIRIMEMEEEESYVKLSNLLKSK